MFAYLHTSLLSFRSCAETCRNADFTRLHTKGPGYNRDARLVSNSIWETDGRTDRLSVRLLDGVWHLTLPCSSHWLEFMRLICQARRINVSTVACYWSCRSVIVSAATDYVARLCRGVSIMKTMKKITGPRQRTSVSRTCHSVVLDSHSRRF